jgi:ABC-type cobalamin/Fe3+-siderophores transport system ATPase subunit
MADTSPSLIVVAGPNGAGKSTMAPALLRGTLGVTEFVNADVIAQGLSAFEPERVAFAAGRILLTRLQELAEQRASFAFGLRNFFTLYQLPAMTWWMYNTSGNVGVRGLK